MQNFIMTLLICSATMSLLAILYIVVTPLLAKRYSEKSRYFVWLIIVVGLIIPFRPQFNSSMVKVIPTETTTPIIQIRNDIIVMKPLENTVISSPETIISSAALSDISIWQIAMIVWVCGMISVLIYHAIKHYRFIKMVHRWRSPISNELILKIALNIKTKLGISKTIGIYQCESVGSPMLIGFANPRILIPTVDFTHDELLFIITHELVHYKNKDLWHKALVLIATAIHWFNPIMYYVAGKIDALCEMSCDVEVVRNSNIDIRQQYSETILNVVRYQSKMKTALSTNFYGGKKNMKKRIFSIMDTRKKRVGLVVICIALLLTFGTGAAMAVSADTVLANSENEIGQTEAMENVQNSDLLESQVEDSVIETTVLEESEGVAMLSSGAVSSLDSVISYLDEATGINMFSVDNGNLWMTQEDFEADNPPEMIIEWWSYDEFVEECFEPTKIYLQDLVGTKEWQPAMGKWEIWTQEMTDSAIESYEEILANIKNGMLYSKTIDGASYTNIEVSLYNGEEEIRMGVTGDEHSLAVSLAW